MNFSQNTIQAINIYRAAPNSEKLTEGAQVKLTPSQKEAIQNLCREHRMDVSTFVRAAVDTYLDIFPYREKVERHRRILCEILERLS